MELLETRALLAGVWDGGGATDDWNDQLNWDNDQLPTATDDVVIGAEFSGITVTSTNDVTINSLTTEAALAISGGTFTIDRNTATNSTINNAITVSATGVLTLDGLSLGGTGTLTNSATVNLLGSTISTALSNQGLLLVKADGGASTIDGALTTNGSSTIRVQADGSVGTATLTVANSFTNNGAIELTAINGSGETATLNVTSGTLTNAVAGTIQSLAGTGGARNLNAQLNNQGLITVAQGLTINKDSADHTNSGTINVNGGDLLVTQSGTTPTFTNSSTGTFTIASGRTLNLSGGSFTNFSGGTLTDGIYNVVGILKFDGAAITTNAATIVLDGASSQIVNESNTNALSGFNNNAAGGNFTIKNGRNFATPSTFTNAGNLIVESSSVFSTTGGTFNFNGGTVTGAPQIIASTLNIGGGATGAATFSTRSSSVLTGNIASGQTILIQGDNSFGAATLTAASGFTNAGTITLESVDGSGSSSNFIVTSGTLTNAVGGVFNSNIGGGGTRTVSANLTNNGTVNINTDTTFSTSSGNYTNNNAFNVASSKTFTINGSSQVFTQAGGTLAATGQFDLTSAAFNFNGGAITGTPRLVAAALNIGAGSTGAATFSTRSSSTLSGNVASGQTILIQGDNAFGAATITASSSFSNAGTISLESVSGSGSSSNFVLSSGTLTNAAGGVFNSNVGGGGTRAVSADLINNGTVNINTDTTFTKSSGSYTNNNAFNIASGKTFVINGSSQIFTQASGTLTAGGQFDLTSAAFNFNGGTITGTPRLIAAALSIGNGSTGAAMFSMRSSSTLSGDIAAAQTILVQGDNTFGAATLTAANGFTNSGMITLQSVANGQGAHFNVTSGTLTNAGTLNFNPDPTAAGSRSMSANLINNGTVNVNNSVTFSKSSGTYTNNNAFNIAADQTLTINGSSQVFTQAGGTLAVDGTFNLISATFNFDDSPDVAGSSVVTGTPVLMFATLNIGAGSTGAATFSMRGSSTFSGNIAAGQTILVQGDSSNSAATLTAANGFTNAGTITLETLSSTSSSNLAVSHATESLTNAATGIINVNTGTGGSRTIAANLVNNGTVNLNESTTFTKSSGSYTNNGDFNLADGKTLVINGSSQAFHQNGGSLDLLGTTALFDLTSAAFNFNGGTVTGTPRLTAAALNIGASSTAAATFSMRSSSTLSGNIAAGQTVLVQGDNNNGAGTLTVASSFSNSGTLTLESVAGNASSSNFTLTSGTLTNAAGGVFNSNAGGGGTRTVSANLINNGTVNINESTTFTKSSGSYTNNNTFNIASGEALTINGSSQVFTQAGGTLAATGLFDMTSAAFNFNGGTVTGTPKLAAVALSIGNGSTGAGTFSMRQSSSLSGDVAAAQTILIQGDSTFGAAMLTAGSSFTNAGTITLQSVDNAQAVTLVVSSGGTLTNAASGVINVNTGSGGARAISADFINNGTVNLNESTLISKNSGSYTNNNAFNIAADKTLTINGSSQVFTQAGGTLAATGLFDMTSAAFHFNGGTVTGTPKLAAVALSIGNGSTGAGTFSMRQSSSLSGDVAAAQTILIQGDASFGAATLTAANSFTNAGTITLQSVDNAQAATLVVSSGSTLTNASSGVINVNTGTGGARAISADLINNGTVNLNESTLFSKNSGSYTNNNAFNIAADKTLTINGLSQVFTQAGGTLAATGLFDITSAAFNFNGGTVTGTPKLTAVALSIGNGSTGAGTFSMRQSSSLSGDVAAAQTILIQGDSTFGAAMLTAGSSFTNAGTITLQSVDNTQNATLAVSSGTLTNTGTLNVNTGTGGGRAISAELANSGVMNVNTAATLGRSSADHINTGTINVTGGDLTVSQSGTTPTFANNGTGIINIADTRTLNISGGELSNFSGGTLTGGTFNITGKLMFPGAAITTNAATVVLNGANSQIVNESDANGLTNFATNAAAGSFTIQNSRNFTTAAGITEFANAGSMNIAAGTTFTVSNAKKYSQTAGTTTLNGVLVTTNSTGVDLQGGVLQGHGDITGHLRNAGQVNPGTSPGSLDVSGNYTQTAAGILNIEIGGTTAITQFDQINITGSASLNGTLNVSLVNSFVPNVADSFQIMTFASHTGDFTTKNGLTISSTLNFDPQFNASGYLLDVNGSPVVTSNASQNVAENTTAATTVTTSDPDVPAQTVTFSIVGGADSAKFQIVAATGALSFVTAPDFEIPTDAGTNNIYNVTIQANDGHGGLTTQDIAVTVTPVNDNSPVFTSSATANVAENTTAVLTVAATDADLPAQSVTFSITGGADAGKFSITSGGVLTFQTAPDFENPTDNGTNNVYNVQVTANDNNGSTTVQNIAVTVTAVNDNNPVFTSAAAVDVAENETAVLTVTATDADQPAQSVTFSLVGGADQSKFSITSGGVLTFQAAPDFENPTDVGEDNIYNVTVQASDGNGGTTTQNIAVTVTPVSENEPVFTSANTANVAENTTAVLTVTATDADLPAQTITFSIFGGADAAKFSITNEGVLTFQAAPDFENPTDAGTNNVYNVIVRANDGNFGITNQSIAVTVTPVNDNSPVFTSAATANGFTGVTAVRTVTATDADQPAQTVTFSITGGADAAKFSITSGGVLTFQTAPDFATPTDVGADNVYDVQVTADDNNGRTTAQDIAVTVTDIPINPPVFTSNATANVAENTTAVLTVTATDPDVGQTATFSIVGGADAAKFSITSAGVLTFQTAPDFEAPTDAGTNNIYNVTVQANDGNGGLATQDIAVTVTPVNDNNPVFTSAATFNVAENTTAIGTVVATDADLPSQTVTYSLSGGADQAKFSITSGGVLTFQATHDFESPNDVGTDNVYNVQVTANDGNGRTTTQDIAVTVTPVNDNNPVFTSATTVNVAENTTAVLSVTATDADLPSQSLSFSLVGGADQAKFSITAGGVLTFQTAPDFENPTDGGTNNVYNVTVQASDGNGGTTTQNIAVTVTPLNDNNPAFTSAATFNVAENSTAIGTVSATDADSPAQSVTFSLTGGADQSKFSITSGGVLTFQAVHDFENPNDVGTNNIYNVQVTASDGNSGTTVQNIAVTVTNLAPSTPTDGDPTGSTIIVNSANGTTVGITAASTDPAGGTVTFTLTNNAGGRFTINNSSGVVTVANSTLISSAATHTITVQASDGNLTASADFTITVTNISADFGDAPTAAQTGFASSYPTGFSNNGAFHLPTGPTLGATRDVEFDGQPNLAASGDDTNGGTDDEDGITFLSSFETGRATAIRVNVQNAAVTGNFLDAWIDWNRDGDWNDSGEQISAGQALVSGDNIVTITVPTTASIGDTYARFRLSTTGELAPTGEATDGEVEDHRVSVAVASAIQIANRGAQPTILQNVGGFLDVISSAGTANRGVSDDGRYVVFVSDSNNLVPEDTNNADDVFRFDRVTGEIRLASVNRTGTASTTGGGSGFARNTNPVISADGQIVAFASQATDLVTNDTNGRTDVFVRNFNTNTTTLVSVNSANTASGNGDSAAPMLSSDGTVVGFLSTSSNLAAGDTNGVQDVFVRNLTTNTTSIVSRNNAGNASGNGLSDRFTLSADGRSVAFHSFATNLTAISDTNGFSDVFVRNLATNTTTLVSVNSAGNNSANNTSFGPSISADGRIVSFQSLASNLVANDTNGATADVFVRNLTTNVTRLVSVNSAGTGSGDNFSGGNVTSADGSTVVFHSTASNLVTGDANGTFDVFVRNLATNATTLVSVSSASAASGNGSSFNPALSANGQTVAFISLASNLTANDSNGVVRDVFVRDLGASTTTLASATASGSGSGASGLNAITISANGRTVAFESDATNLVAGDNNSAKDVFTFAIPGSNAAPSAPLDVNIAANTVIENAATGTVVGTTAFSTDPEAATVTYSLTNNAGGRFAINSSTGVVTVANGGLLDFETATVHTITVQASDGANVSSAQFTINVENDPSIPAELVVNLANTPNTITVSRIAGNLLAVRSGATDLIAPAQFNDFTALRIVGGTGNDSVTLDASLVGFLGAFAMEGNAGNDTLIATAITGVGNFNTQFFGGDGADLARGGAGVDFFDGGAGNDSLLGNAGSDFLAGGADNDSLDGGDGDDQISGGQGNDALIGGGTSALPGNDSLAEVVDGTLTLTATGMTGLGTDTVSGFERATLTGGNGDDTINASTFTGIVILMGGSGNDMLFGGLGADTIRGGEGNDTLVGNAGNDSLEGQAGNDSLTGSAGSDALLGGADDDVYAFATAGTPAEVDTAIELANEGLDLLDFSGVTVAVTVNLTSDGITAPNSLASHANRTVRTGAAGQAANFEGARGGSGADAITGNAADNFLDGGAGNDTLTGNAGNDTLSGGAGADSAIGGTGNDMLNGGDGNDALNGGANDDVYFFQAATATETDTLTEIAGPAEGIDRLDFSSLSVAVSVSLGSDAALASHANRTVKTAAVGQAANFEEALGGAGNDLLNGNAAGNRLDGGGGSDTLNGLAGNDSLIGGLGDDVYFFQAAIANETDILTELLNEGFDRLDFGALAASNAVTVNLSSDTALATHANRTLQTAAAGQAENFENATGGAANDSLTGNAASNSLSGGIGNDTLTGADGNDTLNGGGGNDSLVGQLGDDTYVFVATGLTETDTVSEGANAGSDSLDFTNLAATVPVTVNLTSDLALATYASRTIRTASAGQSANFENAIGGAGNDSFIGNAAANLLRGGAGNDTMEGGAGNDTMEGAPGTDELRQTVDGHQTLTNSSLTGLGDDTINGFARVVLTGGNSANLIDASAFTLGAVTLNGLGDNDTLTGGSMNDSILGGEGTDLLNGGAGNDVVDGGAGDGDSVSGGLGDDVLIGGAGTGDVLVKSVNGTATLTNTTVTNVGVTGSGNDSYSAIELVSITGGSGNDVISATAYTGALVIHGGDGSDQLQAGTGNNTLNGGAGADLLTGNNGNDQLVGGADNDTLVGNAGNDTLVGGLGDDVYRFLAATVAEADVISESEDEGMDRLDFSGLAATVAVSVNLGSDSSLASHANRTITATSGQAANIEQVLGGTGNDSLIGNATNNRLEGGAGNDTLTGGDGNDALLGGVGNDTYRFFDSASAETDTLTELAPDGNDSLDFSGLTVAVTVNLASDASLAAHANRTVVATAGQAANFENVVGGAGNDTLIGNAAINSLNGGAGNDTLEGGLGNDVLTGGLDQDEVRQTVDANQVLTNTSLTGLGTDVLSGIERAVLTGGVKANLLNASAFTNVAVLNGLGGNDTLIGGSGIDSMNGGEGNDSLLGNNGNDTLNGGANDDILDGGVGNDVLLGEEGNDSVVGGLGNDGLDGGNGNDTLKGEAGHDTILGGAGTDQLLGGIENDLLLGEADRDTLTGDDGADSLSGGTGKNTFIDVDPDEGDVIGAFTFDFNTLLTALP